MLLNVVRHHLSVMLQVFTLEILLLLSRAYSPLVFLIPLEDVGLMWLNELTLCLIPVNQMSVVILRWHALEMTAFPAGTNRKETRTSADCSRKLS